jgi:glycosyltransferase involved in cell wall biosynthesis
MAIANDVRAGRGVRLLLVSTLPPPWGGIGKGTQQLIRWIAGRNDVSLQFVDIAPLFRKGFDKRIGSRIIAGLLQGPVDLWKILGHLMFSKPDLMHLHTSGGLAGFRDYFALSAARLLRIPTLYHLHFGNLPEKIRMNAPGWNILRLALLKADYIIVVDNRTKLAIKARLNKKVLNYLPNAIDVSILDKKPSVELDRQTKPSPRLRDGWCRVLYLGWILPTKGLKELIRAWHQLNSNNWELVIIGPGPNSFRRELLKLIDNDSTIFLHDEIPNDKAWQWMKSADIFVLPTYTEGFPNVILEAMAASKSIIATPVGAIPEMLEFDAAEPCGLMVPVGDANALARSLMNLMRDTALRRRLGDLARKKVESQYDSRVIFSRLLAMWRSAAGFQELSEDLNNDIFVRERN